MWKPLALLGDLFVNLWHEIVPGAEKVAEQAFADFETKITPDIIKIAAAAVADIPAEFSGGAAKQAAREAIVTALKNTGHDISAWFTAELDLLIQIVYLPLAKAGRTQTQTTTVAESVKSATA